MTVAVADALRDWLACAVAGSTEPAARAAARAAEGLAGEACRLGTAGHVLDFDDTYLPGLSHLSAPVAPAALVVAASTGADGARLLDAYAAGVEAMAALARASHPALYDGGWHPTAVTGAPGAAVAAARLLGTDERAAAALALLRAGGLRAAFGSDGKSLQVGLAAATGVEAARLVAAGARVDAARIERGPAGFEEAFRATFAGPAPDPGQPGAFDELWIKAYPCCLQTHGAVEAALLARAGGVGAGAPVEVVVHPVSRKAAALDDVADGLQAKFSIPYLTAWALRHGRAPDLAAFAGVDEAARADARSVTIRTDDGLLESEALVVHEGRTAGHVRAALGSPARPLSPAQLDAKVRGLARDRLDGLLDDPARPAADVLDRLTGELSGARVCRDRV